MYYIPKVRKVGKLAKNKSFVAPTLVLILSNTVPRRFPNIPSFNGSQDLPNCGTSQCFPRRCDLVASEPKTWLGRKDSAGQQTEQIPTNPCSSTFFFPPFLFLFPIARSREMSCVSILNKLPKTIDFFLLRDLL